MKTINQYSEFLYCMHDECTAYGSIGRGCHYSIFSVPEWMDVKGARTDVARMHRFAVIWDEDHDTRVIEAIEQIYRAGLLFPVTFVGERKGTLNLIFSSEFVSNLPASDIEQCKANIAHITENLPDYWPCYFGVFESSSSPAKSSIDDFTGLINDTTPRVGSYLQNIANLWSL